MADPTPLVFSKDPGDVVTALAHYYRGELSRMISWRNRIDLTTNWAIGAVAGMLSLSLSSPTASHGLLLFAMIIVFLILVIEARRYRFFHIYRTRVRMLERHYYAQLFSGLEITAAEHWMERLGDDLRAPHFSITLTTALSRRLRRNYIWMFLILLSAWLLKATGILIDDVAVWSEGLFAHADIGPVPGGAVTAGVAVFYAILGILMLRHGDTGGEFAYGDAHM